MGIGWNRLIIKKKHFLWCESHLILSFIFSLRRRMKMMIFLERMSCKCFGWSEWTVCMLARSLDICVQWQSPPKLNILMHLGPDNIAGYWTVLLYSTVIFLAYRTGYWFFLNYVVLHVWWLLPTIIKYKNYSSFTLQSVFEMYSWLNYILSCLLWRIAFYCVIYVVECIPNEKKIPAVDISAQMGKKRGRGCDSYLFSIIQPFVLLVIFVQLFVVNPSSRC